MSNREDISLNSDWTIDFLDMGGNLAIKLYLRFYDD